ncbi:prolyl oligopeptidase family serine peptidase [Massilia sp. W12]|uniref:S9 family peptidase n=1 Tax=Massilia sp. W12 TaxID=3126507 RepID=UPI0030CC2897
MKKSMRLLAIAMAGMCQYAVANQAAPANAAPASEILAPNPNLRADGIPPISAALAQKIAPYTEFRPRRLLDWHPQKRQILLSTRGKGNTQQLHISDGPDAPLRQITDFADPVRDASFQPTHGEFLVYLKDEGGNEAGQAYRLDLASGASMRLSDPDQKNGVGGWDSKGQRIVIFSTPLDRTAKGATRAEISTDVWLVDPLAPQDKRKLASLPGGGWGGFQFSPDDKKLLALNYTSANSASVWLLDVKSGKAREILPAGAASAPVRWHHPRFSADGKSIFVAGDADGEFMQLNKVDLKSGKRTILSQAIPWDVTEIDPSPDGRLVALRINRDGLQELHMFDAKSGKQLAQPALPPGAVERLVWRHKGPGKKGLHSELALTINSSKSPGEIWTLPLQGGSAGPAQAWTRQDPGTLDSSEFPDTEIVRWQSFDMRSISGLITRAPAHKFKGRRPVLISIHGGPEAQATIGFLSRHNYAINELGITLIQPNVRGSSGYGKTFLKLDNGVLREDSVKDIGALLDWIAAQPDLDPNRVMVMGGSYGGYMSLAVSTHYAERIAGAVDMVGISHFTTFLERTESYRRDLRRVEYGDERIPEMRAFFDKIAPLNNADKIRKPLFVVQGKNDPRVPVHEAEQIVARAKQNKAPVWYLLADNEGHGFARKNNQDFYYAALATFMQEYLLK